MPLRKVTSDPISQHSRQMLRSLIELCWKFQSKSHNPDGSIRSFEEAKQYFRVDMHRELDQQIERFFGKIEKTK